MGLNLFSTFFYFKLKIIRFLFGYVSKMSYICSVKQTKGDTDMEKVNKNTLHIYWEDDVTVECRDFPNKKAAEQYAKDNGCVDYMID